MSPDLGDVIAYFTAGPQDPPPISGGGTWGPRTVALKQCCGEVLAGEDCDCADLLAELEQANRHPIIFRFNARKAA